jgi:hypothetical protein
VVAGTLTAMDQLLTVGATWVPIAVSVVALVFSGVALRRGSAPKAHWSIRVKWSFDDDEYDGVQRGVAWEITQLGPGTAEKVEMSFQVFNQGWRSFARRESMKRHEKVTGEVTLEGSERQKTPLRIRVEWAEMPDTRKRRPKVFKITVPPFGPPARAPIPRPDPHWAVGTPPPDDWA